jgi:hypothetical protein
MRTCVSPLKTQFFETRISTKKTQPEAARKMSGICGWRMKLTKIRNL